MIFITGPLFSGKRTFAAKLLNCSYEELSLKAIIDAQNLVLKYDNIEELVDILSNKPVVIATEIGCGVVPIDAEDRAFRELAGRLSIMLSQKATTVIRLFCGIPTILKGEI